MVDAISKIIPWDLLGPLVLATILWAGCHYVFVGPEVGRRLGALKYEPVCTSQIENLQTAWRAERQEQRERAIAERDALKRYAQKQAEVAREKTEALRRTYDDLVPKELKDLLAVMSGNPDVVNDLGTLLIAPNVSKADGLALPKIPKELPPARPEGRAAFCSCVVDQAMSTARVDLALYTGSLRIFVPERIAHFKQLIAETVAGKACGPVPVS